MAELREKLISAHKRGNFLEIVYEEYLNLGDDRKSVGKEIALLNNEGTIDAIAEFRRVSNGLKGVDFYSICHVVEDVLPEINAPVASVMDCVKHIIIEAGNDLAAGWFWLFTPFIKYCDAYPNRPREVLKITEKSGGEWLDFIAPAIIAGSNLQLSEYINIAIVLTHHDNIEVRIRAVFALGRINYCNDTSQLTNALRALENVIQAEDNDRLYGTAIKSAFLFYIADSNIESDIIKLIKVALANKGDFALDTASELFGFNIDKIPVALLDELLDALKNTKPQNKSTLDNIDFGLQHLLKSNQEEKAISFLEYLLIKNNNELSVVVFNGLTYDLCRNNRPILNKLATRWILSKKVPLCRAVMDIIQLGHGVDIDLLADKDQFAKQSEEICLFAARKVTGWLFDNPVSCTSFIMSLIDFSSNKELEQIADLLFNPLLISYPGKVKEYLEKEFSHQSAKVQEVVSNLLVKLENYHEGLKAAWDIPELLPSQAQRETYLRLFNRKMGKSFKEVQKNSIMNQFVSRSVLLYGRKLISYFNGPNNKINRIETPLQSFGHSIEYPRLEYMDPHGLDYMLRIFRIEKCEK